MKKRIAIVLNDRLATWQAINVTGHLALALGNRAAPEIMGQHPLVDASGIPHMGISRYPIIALRATAEQIRGVTHAARSRAELLTADYPWEMLDTDTDSELIAAMAAKAEASFEYLGLAILGPVRDVKSLTGALPLWK